MAGQKPFEIIAAPFTLWTAPIGTEFPALSETPSSPWTLVGSNGDQNYAEEGVSVKHQQKINLIRTLADPGPIKAFRTEETLQIGLMLLDVTLEQYAYALNQNSVNEGESGEKSIALRLGSEVTQMAILVRGVGVDPYMAEGNMQYEVPVVIQMAEPEVVYRRGVPAGLKLEFVALADLDAISADQRFGVLRIDFDAGE